MCSKTTVYEGGDLHLECIARGSPQPGLQWLVTPSFIIIIIIIIVIIIIIIIIIVILIILIILIILLLWR